jgi:DNA-binding response OmpR family regulator
LTLDLRLSEERGLDLLADIRIQRVSHAAPVIGVTMPAATDVGATFSIANLQCKPIRSDEIQAAMSCFRLLQPGCASMLVIDDDPLALDVMRATLKSIDIDAVCVLNGRDAWRNIDQLRSDAINLDLIDASVRRLSGAGRVAAAGRLARRDPYSAGSA